MSGDPSKPPTVFISYSHGSEDHQDRVLAFADQLLKDGVDCVLDQYEKTAPAEGWPSWSEQQIRQCDFVLIVCTETYLRRFQGEEQQGEGHGSIWESRLIIQELYNARMTTRKFIAVLLAGDSAKHIPGPLRGVSRYQVATEPGYEGLYRHLTDQPAFTKPELGKLRTLPPRKRKQHVFVETPVHERHSSASVNSTGSTLIAHNVAGLTNLTSCLALLALVVALIYTVVTRRDPLMLLTAVFCLTLPIIFITWVLHRPGRPVQLRRDI